MKYLMYYKFSSEFVHRYWGGLCTIFSSSIEQQKQVYNREAKDVGVVHNERMNRLHVYSHRLHVYSHIFTATC